MDYSVNHGGHYHINNWTTLIFSENMLHASVDDINSWQTLVSSENMLHDNFDDMKTWVAFFLNSWNAVQKAFISNVWLPCMFSTTKGVVFMIIYKPITYNLNQCQLFDHHLHDYKLAYINKRNTNTNYLLVWIIVRTANRRLIMECYHDTNS